MLSRGLMLVIAIVLIGPAAVRADFESGMAAFEARDYAGAFRELRPIAEQGDSRAQTILGVMYRTGLLGFPDYELGARWFRSASDLGDPEADYNLGLMYFQGETIPPGANSSQESLLAAAVQHFSRAAAQGHAGSQLYMGHLTAEGIGTDRDPVEAYKWYQLAAWQRNSLAVAARERLAAKMSPVQIAEAKELARDWQAIKPRRKKPLAR